MFKNTTNEKYYFLLKYYLLMFLRGIFFLKIYVAVILKNTLTPIQISNIISIYSITTIILEIPVGFLAGKIGYKKILLIGIFSYMLSYIFLLNTKNVLTFSIYYACRSLYSSVFDSSFEALVYGNIRYFKLKDLFAEYRNLSRLCRMIAISGASYVAGIFAWSNTNLIILFDIFILIVHIIVILGIKERKTEGAIKLNTNYKKLFMDSINYFVKHRILRNFLIFQSMWVAIIALNSTYRSLYFEEINIKTSSIGFMLSIQTILAAFAQLIFIKYLINTRHSTKIAMFLLSGIFCLISIHYYNGMISYIFYTLFFILLQIADSLTYPETVRSVPERLMPVLLPAFNIITELFKFIVLYIFGYIANINSYKNAFFVMFMIFTIFNIIAFLIINYDKHLLKKYKQQLLQ